MLSITVLSFGQNVFISEINYTGSDKGIELSVDGTMDLSGWSLVFYKGTNRKVYHTIDLSQNLSDGALWIEYSNISDGHPKGAGVALISDDGDVQEFLSYNGSFAAKDGPAANYKKESINIGTITDNSGSEGKSLQKVGDAWVSLNKTPGTLNSNRTASVTKNQIDGFNVYPNPVREGLFSISTKNSFEKHVIIYSILGSVVYEKTVGANELVNVKNLSVGMYLVQVEEDEKVSIKKLLIN